MTKEEAILILRNNKPTGSGPFDKDLCEAIDGAIEALEAQGKLIHCIDCTYYDAPICRLYSRGDMTSRQGYCYHARRKENETV